MPCDTHGSNCDGKCIDPNVDNGMMTKVWGPTGWLFLHCVTFGYPYAINPENPDHKYKKRDYKLFFEKLGDILPCKYCRDSYKEFIKEHPIDKHLNKREDLCKWLYDIHNKVNKKLGVPDCDIPNFKEVQQNYETFRAKCKKTTDEERIKNSNKGCVNPADGTPKKSIINIVNWVSGDITRRTEKSSNIDLLNNLINYIKTNKYEVIFISIVIILLVLKYNKKIKKILKI